jgi:DNA-binding NtrC family response regulator
MPAQKTKIVIIDDEEDLCFLLSNLLTAQGFEVNYFFTLSSGLEGIATIKPSWIIIDNDLPDGSGWEKTNLILDSIPDVNIIKISANPDSTRSNYETNVHYLIKPIHVNSIVELIPKTEKSS